MSLPPSVIARSEATWQSPGSTYRIAILYRQIATGPTDLRTLEQMWVKRSTPVGVLLHWCRWPDSSCILPV